MTYLTTTFTEEKLIQAEDTGSDGMRKFCESFAQNFYAHGTCHNTCTFVFQMSQ